MMQEKFTIFSQILKIIRLRKKPAPRIYGMPANIKYYYIYAFAYILL